MKKILFPKPSRRPLYLGLAVLALSHPLVSYADVSAESQTDNNDNQFIEISASLWKEAVATENKSFTFSPLGGSVLYGITLDDSWSLSFSYGNYQDDAHFALAQGTFEREDWQVQLTRYRGDWWLSAGVYQSKEDVSVHGPRASTESGNRMEQNSDFLSAGIGIGRDLSTETFLWSVTGTLEYQDEQQDTTGILRAGQIALGEKVTRNSNGWQVTLTASIHSFHNWNDHMTLTPMLSVSWSEPIQGETRGLTQMAGRSPTGTQRLLREESTSSRTGSGQLGVSLGAYSGHWSGTLSATTGLDGDTSLSRMEDELVWRLGVGYGF